jgi:metal-responsive CopG/Arc/MetJ family transcriptional regulator
MSDVVVSIRMPKTMAFDLKQMAIDHHYIDLSEQIRDIIREKSLKKLREINQATSFESKQSRQDVNKDKLIAELLKIVEELKK